MTEQELVDWCAHQARTLRAIETVLDRHQGDIPADVYAKLDAILRGNEID